MNPFLTTLCVLFTSVGLTIGKPDFLDLIIKSHDMPLSASELVSIAEKAAEMTRIPSELNGLKVDADFLNNLNNLSATDAKAPELWLARRSLCYLLSSYCSQPRLPDSTRTLISQHLLTTLKRYTSAIEQLAKLGAIKGRGGSLSGIGFSAEQIKSNRLSNELNSLYSDRNSLFANFWMQLKFSKTLSTNKELECFFCSRI